MQAALAVFADNVFPDVDWGAKLPEELLMASTIYQRGEAAGELAGQRKTLTRPLTKRLGAERAAMLVARLQRADESGLDSATDVLAEKLSDEALLTRLDEILPRPEADATDPGE